MTLQEQAGQSGLVLCDEREEWYETDWPPLAFEWPTLHALVVLEHPHPNDENHHKKGQTVVVLMGGERGCQDASNSVLVLNLADPNKQWREGPTMKKGREGHAAVVCNGAVYVMGGSNGADLDCMERIDANDLLQSFSTTSRTHESNWTTLNCRLSTRRSACCAVSVHNRYIVVMGGCDGWKDLSLVDIIDTRTHTVIAGPSMNVPRSYCGSAIIGHRIFVIGGQNEIGGEDELDSVEYLDFEEETKDGSLSAVVSFSSTWTVHSDLFLSDTRTFCRAVAVGSCLVVAGGEDNPTVEVLDTHCNRVWNLPPVGEAHVDCNMVTVANEVAVIGGRHNPSCATLPLMDKNTWCFRRLCEQPRNEWYHCLEGMGIRDVNLTSCANQIVID